MYFFEQQGPRTNVWGGWEECGRLRFSRSSARTLAIFWLFLLPFWLAYWALSPQRQQAENAPFGPPLAESQTHGLSRSFALPPGPDGENVARSVPGHKKRPSVRHSTTLSKPPVVQQTEPPAPMAGLTVPGAVRLSSPRLRLPGHRFLSQSDPPADALFSEADTGPAVEAEPRQLNVRRLIGVQLAAAVAGYRVFTKYNQFFGGVAQPFRIGNDWTKDNAIYADELLHFQGTYRLTQAITELYRWAGLSQTRAELLGATIAATAMTFLEYIDGRRKDDEASYSDLTANFLGVTFALLKPRVPLFKYIDFHVSYRGITDPLKKRKLLNYDRITHWLSVDMEPIVHVPVRAAIGYGVSHAFRENAHPKLLLGLGIGLGQLLKNHTLHLPGPFGWLDVYQVGLQIQVL